MIAVLAPEGVRTQGQGSVIRLDPAFDAIVAPGAMVETLYVNDSNKRVIMRYDVQPDGTVANGRLLLDMSTGKGAGNPDGMRFDANGNLYAESKSASYRLPATSYQPLYRAARAVSRTARRS